MTWWIDETPWPGPSEHEVTLDDFRRVYMSVGKAYGRTANSLIPGMSKIFEGIIGTVATYTHIFTPEVKPNLNKNGPRRGTTFDHRGRRRW